MRSPQPTSSIEPIETKRLNPTFSRRLQSSTAVHRAPLWLMKPTLPGRAIADGEGGVDARDRAHDAEAVGADDAHRPAARFLENLPLQLGAGLAGLLETGRDDDRAFHAGVDALADDAGHGRRRRDDDGEIDGVGHRRDRRVRLDAEHARALRVDRKDRAAERVADQIPENRPADAARLLGRADDGDVARREDRVERTLEAEDGARRLRVYRHRTVTPQVRAAKNGATASPSPWPKEGEPADERVRDVGTIEVSEHHQGRRARGRLRTARDRACGAPWSSQSSLWRP